MGWKGTVRSVNAAINRADRNAKKRQRELEVRRKQYSQMLELEQAAYEVEVFENHIDIVQSMHKDVGDKVDWHELSQSLEPEEPSVSNEREAKAINEKDNYKPSVIDRIFKRAEKKLKSLEAAVDAGRNEDKRSYEASLNQWRLDRNEWLDGVEQARLIISGDPKAKIKVVEELNPFSEIDNLGSSLHFSVAEGSVLSVTINVHSDNVIPSEQKSLLKSGKLSIKKMPVGKFNEIYQDYVCSSVLRVANEVFAILPDEYILIDAKDKLLNKSTGHLEDQSILSVCVSRNTLLSLNMDSIDPSDSMRNFIHNMSFKKN